MSGPEDNPADELQPTKEEWEAYELSQGERVLQAIEANVQASHDALSRYRVLENLLQAQRFATLGCYSIDEVPITDEMTEVWCRLTRDQMDMLNAEPSKILNIREPALRLYLELTEQLLMAYMMYGDEYKAIEAIIEDMDAPWYAMSQQARDAINAHGNARFVTLQRIPWSSSSLAF